MVWMRPGGRQARADMGGQQVRFADPQLFSQIALTRVGVFRARRADVLRCGIGLFGHEILLAKGPAGYMPDCLAWLGCNGLGFA
jgi:hypothetical protein